MKMLATVFLLLVVGCGGQSALDKCTDGVKHLWNNKATDNSYAGNEAYWDAVKVCESKH